MKDRVLIEAYNDVDVLVHSSSVSGAEWYEALHPIVDELEERIRLKVTRLVISQFDSDGLLSNRAVNKYNQAGIIVHSEAVAKDGTVTSYEFDSDGTIVLHK